MGVKFTYYGGMCVLVERSDGKKLLFDPYISKNPQTEVPVSRFYDVDYVFVTHNANDHYGDVEELMTNSRATLISGSDVVRRIGEVFEVPRERRIGTMYGDEREIDGVTKLHTVTAIHHSKTTKNGVTASAPAFGFIVDVEPGITYYHAGDTCLFSDMKLYRELYHPHVMAVGIWKFKEPYPPCDMAPREAAYAVSYAGPEVVIPTHYPKGSSAPSVFERHLETLAPHVAVKSEIEKTFVCTPFRVE